MTIVEVVTSAECKRIVSSKGAIGSDILLAVSVHRYIPL